jgi:hypothetical protein
MANKRGYHLPEFASALAVPALYYIFTELGLDGDSAGVYAAAVGAFFMACALWWRAQENPDGNAVRSVGRVRLVMAAAGLVVAAFLVETVVSAVVLGIAGTALEQVDATEAAPRVREAVNYTFALPIGMFAIYCLGFWSAWILPVARPLRWLLVVVIVWYSLRLSLYSVVQSYGEQEEGVRLHESFWTALRGAVIFAALSYGFLAAGNFFGRRRFAATRPGDAPSSEPPV